MSNLDRGFKLFNLVNTTKYSLKSLYLSSTMTPLTVIPNANSQTFIQCI